MITRSARGWSQLHDTEKKVSIAIKYDKFSCATRKLKIFGRSKKEFIIDLVFSSYDAKENDSNILCQFIIERQESSEASNLKPAVLTCKGCLALNGNKLAKNQRQILQNGDKIELEYEKKSYVFIDQRNSAKDLYPVQVTDLYYIGKIIGTGYCGVVCIAYDLKTLEKFAIKTVSIDYLTEITIMNNIDHPNLLKLKKLINGESAELYLLTEYMNAGNLLEQVLGTTLQRFTEEDSKFAVYQILQGLKYLHDRNIAHLDIKLDNVMAKVENDDILYKIGDFGLSGPDVDLSVIAGTCLYLAPEVSTLKSGDVYSGKMSDMWSLGVLLYACLSGTFPFRKDYSDLEAHFTSVETKFRYKVWETISDNAKEVIECLLQFNVEDRWNATEILLHPWFDDEEMMARIEKLVAKVKPDVVHRRSNRRRTIKALEKKVNKRMTTA